MFKLFTFDRRFKSAALSADVINISEPYGSSRKVINFVTFSCNDV